MISAIAVLITQLGSAFCSGFCNDITLERESRVTGTIVNLFWGIRIAPPSFDTSIVPEVLGVLNALFKYGLTKEVLNSKEKQIKLILKILTGDHYEHVSIKKYGGIL